MKTLLLLIPAALFAQSYSQTPHVVQNKAGASTTTAEFCLQYTDAALKCVAASTSGWIPKSGTTVDMGLAASPFRDGFFSRDLKAPTVHVTDLYPTSGSGGIISIFGELWPAGIGGEKLGSSSSIRRFSEAHITDGYFYDDVVISDALQVGGATQLGGHLTWGTDNTYNIGSVSGNRPKDIHATGGIVAMYSGTSNTGIGFTSSIMTTVSSGGTTTGTWISSSGAHWASGGYSAGSGAVQVINSSSEWVGYGIKFPTDNTYDIGTISGNRPNDIFAAGSVTVQYAGTSNTGAGMTSTTISVANSGGTATGIWYTSSGALWSSGGFIAGAFPGSAGITYTTTAGCVFTLGILTGSGGGTC